MIGRVVSTGGVIEVRHDRAITAVDDLLYPPATVSFLSPGFIDLQVNGFAGVDYNDPQATPAAIAGSIRTMFSTGVTRFFPTVITGAQSAMESAFRNLARAKREFARSGLPEAEAMEGFHAEGPHISPEDGPRGAHPVEHVRPPDLEEWKRLQQAADGNLRLVTISPAWTEAPAFIREAVREGAVVSIGHTTASAEQIEAAVDAGASMSTHLGNGANAHLPKTENYIWDQLANDRLIASFIADGIHLPASFLRTAIRAKGVERAVLVTDAVMPAMCEPGAYKLGAVEVELQVGGRVVLKGGTRLAGSALRMDAAIETAVRLGGVSLRDALTMATVNPARAGRIAARRRGISTGEKADLVRFDYGEDLNKLTVLETVVAGETVYKA